jgi:hypothetical protein
MHKLEVLNPQCVVLAGNRGTELRDDLKAKSFELYRENLTNVMVVTFDELFRKAEVLASMFNLRRAET